MAMTNGIGPGVGATTKDYLNERIKNSSVDGWTLKIDADRDGQVCVWAVDRYGSSIWLAEVSSK